MNAWVILWKWHPIADYILVKPLPDDERDAQILSFISVSRDTSQAGLGFSTTLISINNDLCTQRTRSKHSVDLLNKQFHERIFSSQDMQNSSPAGMCPVTVTVQQEVLPLKKTVHQEHVRWIGICSHDCPDLNFSWSVLIHIPEPPFSHIDSNQLCIYLFL